MVKAYKTPEAQAAMAAAMAAFLAEGKTVQAVAPQPNPKVRTAQ